MEEMSEGLLNRNMQLLSQINSKEFVGSQFSDKEKTPNLSKMTQESTQLSNFVTLSILIPTPIQKGENDTDKMLVNRAKTIEFFIDLASLCLQKGDFSSAIAINGGLNNASVQRLSDTQEKIDHKHKKDFNTLNELTKKNYKSLRSQVAERQKNNMPYIPFLGVINTDYTFSSDGNPKIVDGQIYKGRIEATSNALAEIEKPQEMIKNFQTKNTGNKPQQNIMSVINLDTTALSKKLLDENSNIILPEKIENLNKFVDEQSLIIQPRKQK